MLVLLLLIISSIQCTKDNDNNEEFEESICFIEPAPDTYDYPIKPGMPEWEELITSAEMDSVLQIPEDVLNNISTRGLVETVLNYPRFLDLYFIDNYQQAFDILTENFNGFQELMDRKDAGIELLKRYEQMHPGCKDNNNWPSIGEPGSSASFAFTYIEIIIAQYDILNQYDNEELIKALNEAVTKYKLKKRYDYSIFCKKHSVLIVGRVLHLIDYNPFIEEYNTNLYIKDFIDKVKLNNNFSTLDLINDYAKKYLNQMNDENIKNIHN
jgi:hypothetical protein